MKSIVLSALMFAAPSILAQQQLEVRNIRIGMTPEQVDSAAKAAGMHLNPRKGNALIEYLDPQASGRPVGGNFGSGGSGLVLQIKFEGSKASEIVIQEQGDTMGNVGRDLQKKWGPPKRGFQNPSHVDHPWWGDPKTGWADFDPSPMGFYGCNVTIYGPVKTAPPRQGVPM